MSSYTHSATRTRTSTLRMCCASIAMVLVAGMPAGEAYSQLTIDATSIVEGQAGVAPVDSIHITFTTNRKLPFSSSFTPKFKWEPRGGFQRTYVFLDADRQNPRFTVTHRNNTDFSVYVFGVEAENGSRMERPFTLNYSTSPTMGARTVAGSVAIGERTPPASKLARMVREAHVDDADQTIIRHDRVGTLSKAGTDTYHAVDEDRTVVLLLDSHNVNPLQWDVLAAAAVQANHGFQFSHVRDGEYYPVAVNWSDDTGETIGGYGYYDPDQDYSPDPIIVAGGNVEDIEITIYPYQTATGLSDRFLAQGLAQQIAVDAVLVSTAAASLEDDGHSIEWAYRFYSPSLNEDIQVAVDPLTAYVTSAPSTLTIAPQGIPASGVLDSDEALVAADAQGGATFTDLHPGATVSMTGGYALDAYPQAPETLIWSVTYTPSVGSLDPPFVVNLDMADGSIITDVEPFAEPSMVHVSGVWPNPFTDAVHVEVRLPAPTSVEASVYDLLGRRVDEISSGMHDAGTHILYWRSNLAPGPYLVRVTAGSQVVTRQVFKAGS